MNISILNSGTDLRAQLSKVWKLSVPAILTQITIIAMQYIDSATLRQCNAGASNSL